jgi:Uma2 family endonuclease
MDAEGRAPGCGGERAERSMATARAVADRAAVAGQRIPMAYDAWRAWEVEGLKSEWVDGEVIVFMPATARHGDLLSFLSTLLTAYVRFFGLGRLITDSIEMHLPGRGRVPDLLFVPTDQLPRLEETRLSGPAALVVEIVSPDSVERDHDEKKAEYAAAGVQEYWVVEARSDQHGATFFRLVDGAYEPIPLDAEGRLWSTVVDGFWLKPAWLARDPLPNALACLFTIVPGIADAALAEAKQTDSA